MRSKTQLTLMGVGLDWKASLIKDLAKISEGKWYYIDVNQKEEAKRIFVEEFETLAATGFMNVEMHLRPMKDVNIKRTRQVVPEIKELPMTKPEETASDGQPRHAAEGRLAALHPRPEPAQAARRQVQDCRAWKSLTTWAWASARRPGQIPLEMTYTAAGHGHINAEVMKHIDEVQIFELNNKLQEEIAKDNKEEHQAGGPADREGGPGDGPARRQEDDAGQAGVAGTQRGRPRVEEDPAGHGRHRP